MPEKMQALCVDKYKGDLHWVTVDRPKPTEYQVLAKTICTGLCHTDIHSYCGDLSEDPKLLPIVPGHEGIGIVVEVGSKVTKFKINDRIGVPWLGKSCMNCSLCDLKKYNLCPNQVNTGFNTWGACADYFVADERFSAKIPAAMASETAAPMVCAGLTVYAALKRAKLNAGDQIVISGACGGLGHLAITFAARLNLVVIALDFMTDERVKLVKERGAAYAVDAKQYNTSEKLAKHISSLNPSKPRIAASIILAPVLTAVPDAIEYVSPGGSIITIALAKGSYSVPVATFTLKALSLVGSIVGTPEDLDEALEIAGSNNITAHVTVRDKSQMIQSFKDLEEGKITGRVVIKF